MEIALATPDGLSMPTVGDRNDRAESSPKGDRPEENVNNSAIDSQPRSASIDVIKNGAPETRTVICDRCYLSKRPEPLPAFAGDLCILADLEMLWPGGLLSILLMAGFQTMPIRSNFVI